VADGINGWRPFGGILTDEATRDEQSRAMEYASRAALKLRICRAYPVSRSVFSSKSMKLPNRLSLRTALLSMTCVCLAAAWLGTSERTEDHRRTLVADFQARGARISMSRIDEGRWAYLPKMLRPWQSHIRLNNTALSGKEWDRSDEMNAGLLG
jgi:hypothetical protein